MISILCVISSYWYGWVAAFSKHMDPMHGFSLGCEVIFFLGIGINCLREYIPDGETNPVKSLPLIFKHYVKYGTFWEDIVTIFPLQIFFLGTGFSNYFYLIKMYRIKNGLEIFHVQNMTRIIREIVARRTLKKIKEDNNIGEDTINDHNNIEGLLFTSYILKTIKIMLVISNITYFLGVLWIVLT